MSRRLNLPPSYILIHRVSTAGIGVLCQLECEGPFRAEMIRWIPGYSDADMPADGSADGDVTAGELTAGESATDEPAAKEITTGKLATSGLIVNGLSPHGLSANGLTTNGLPANGLPVSGLTVNGLTTKELTVEELTVEELTAGELPAEGLPVEGPAEGPATDAAAGPGEPDPVGPARSVRRQVALVRPLLA